MPIPCQRFSTASLDKTKTSLCISVKTGFGKSCPYPPGKCQFAHSIEELRVAPGEEPQCFQVCSKWANGVCDYGDHCKLWHGWAPPPRPVSTKPPLVCAPCGPAILSAGPHAGAMKMPTKSRHGPRRALFPPPRLARLPSMHSHLVFAPQQGARPPPLPTPPQPMARTPLAPPPLVTTIHPSPSTLPHLTLMRSPSDALPSPARLPLRSQPAQQPEAVTPTPLAPAPILLLDPSPPRSPAPSSPALNPVRKPLPPLSPTIWSQPASPTSPSSPPWEPSVPSSPVVMMSLVASEPMESVIAMKKPSWPTRGAMPPLCTSSLILASTDDLLHQVDKFLLLMSTLI